MPIETLFIRCPKCDGRGWKDIFQVYRPWSILKESLRERLHPGDVWIL